LIKPLCSSSSLYRLPSLQVQCEELAPSSGALADAASSKLFGEGERGKAAQLVGYLVVLGRVGM
jgi:hypothetical protein